MVKQNRNLIKGETLFGEMLQTLDEATSLKRHLENNQDFYRRQWITNNGASRPNEPAKQIDERIFVNFWMGKLESKKEVFQKMPKG